jgi:hypothetical protein
MTLPEAERERCGALEGIARLLDLAASSANAVEVEAVKP